MTERVFNRVAAIAAIVAATASPFASAQGEAGNPSSGWPALSIGAVLDGTYFTDPLALGAREQGFGLGHTEVSMGAAVDGYWTGRLTVAAASHDGNLEAELEEAFVETSSLPAGLQVRGGRFLSQIGYLNERHTHSDDFVERPLLYRAVLGGHFFDDGVRLNWVAPTSLYWRTGIEIFSGNQLVREAQRKRSVGVLTFNTRIGGDAGIEHSWQAGFSYLRNELDPVSDEHAGDGGHDHDHGHNHAHAHGAAYTGQNLFLLDGVWKWSPNGNNRERELKISGEYALVTRLNQYATSNDRHDGGFVSAVYRFAPAWEAGVRWDSLEVREPHGDHFHSARLQEASAVLTWKPSHFSQLRLQWTGQRSQGGFDAAADSVVAVQYVMSLGAHGAHQY